MISLADFQPLSIGKIKFFPQQPRFYSQIHICILSKSMLVKRSRFVYTLHDAASFCRLSSFIGYLNHVHYAIAIECSFRLVVYRKQTPCD